MRLNISNILGNLLRELQNFLARMFSQRSKPQTTHSKLPTTATHPPWWTKLAVSPQLLGVTPTPCRHSSARTQRQHPLHRRCHRCLHFRRFCSAVTDTAEHKYLQFVHFGRPILNKFSLRPDSPASYNLPASASPIVILSKPPQRLQKQNI